MFEIVTGCKGILVFSFLTGVSLVYYNSYIRPESTKNDYNNFSMIDHEMGQKQESKFQYTSEQKRRLTRLKNYCVNNKKAHSIGKIISYSRNIQNLHTRGTPKGLLFASRKKKALYCAVPKAASTNWKRMLIVMEGEKTLTQLRKKSKVHLEPSLLSVSSFSPGQRKSMLMEYYKFIFVRNPFERIVSAYRNKLADNNTFFERTYGTRILRFTRKHLTEKEYNDGKGTTFEEFARWVAEKHPFDPHWVPISQLCKPCTIPYTFVGKIESLYNDSEQVLNHLGTDEKFPKTWSDGYKTSSHKLMLQYFSKMPSHTVDKLYRYYEEDFNAFGYDIPMGINYTRNNSP